MTLDQNQFGIAPVVGQLVLGDNVKTCEFYDASSDTTIVPGEYVTMKATTNPGVTRVQKGSAVTDKYVGVVLQNAIKASWVSGEKLDVAFGFTEVMCTASAAITAGDALEYDYVTGKVKTKTASNTVVSMAMEDAASADDLVRVLIQTNFA
jgi:hypothetical protein